MQKNLLSTAVVAALGVMSLPASLHAADAAPASPHTFAPNIGITSNYLYRGISQTAGKPALSAGLDYSHSSGIYLGTWLSQVTWVKDAYTSGSTEWDFYGGYKNTFAGGDWNYDLGILRYTYPGKGKAIPGVNANPDTTEVYGAIGYKWLTLKYSHVVSGNIFGWIGNPDTTKDTKGSTYIELNAAYDLGNGWGVNGHYGQQKIANNNTTTALNTASYNDWKIGVSKDAGFGVFGLSYSATDAKGGCNRTTGATATNGSAYCWGTAGGVNGVSAPTRDFNDVAKGTLVLDFKKTF